MKQGLGPQNSLGGSGYVGPENKHFEPNKWRFGSNVFPFQAGDLLREPCEL